MNSQVVHTTAGRFRIRVPQVTNDLEYANKLNWLVESLDFVTSVRINPAASSLIVNYEASMVSIAAAQEKLFTCIQQASVVEIPLELKLAETIQTEVNVWERLSLPIASLGIALLAGPVELSIPFLLVGGLIAGAAVPIFSKASASLVSERKFKVDVLDSLWITLQTLQGQYVAPALMVSLVESGTTVRDITANKDTHEVQVAHFAQAGPVADTQVGNYVEEVSEQLVLPTLFLCGSIFALTGDIAPALATLQLDFGTGVGIAVPTTILAALTYAARSGLYIRNGRILEVLARTDTIVFGKIDTLTHSSASAIAALTNSGIATYLLIDDPRQLVKVIATQQGIEIDRTYTEAFPEQKLEVLHDKNKTVAYVGDGLSDTDADADISVCFAQTTEIEQLSADVVLVGNDLRALVQAINIAKQTMEIVEQNITLVAVPNISVVLAGVLFGLNPVAAVLINYCATILAEMNGLRRFSVTDIPASSTLIAANP